MTRCVTIKERAIADLDAIYWHSAEKWGRQQARAYLEALEGLFQLLAVEPEIARERIEFDPPVRLHPFRSHVVAFRADETIVDILRVVHARSDWQAVMPD